MACLPDGGRDRDDHGRMSDKPFSDLAIGWVHPQDAVDPYFNNSCIRVARETEAMFIAVPSGPKIDKGRNMVVDQFLSTDKEWLLFVDTDMTFSPSMIGRLYEKRSENVILSGFCRMADNNPVPKLRKQVDGEERWFVIGDPGEEVVAVDITGAAFLLAHRSVYEKVAANNPGPRPYFAFTERFGTADMSEDGEFCVRAKECGFEIHVDGSVRPGHRKVMTVGGDSVPE